MEGMVEEEAFGTDIIEFFISVFYSVSVSFLICFCFLAFNSISHSGHTCMPSQPGSHSEVGKVDFPNKPAELKEELQEGPSTSTTAHRPY